MYRLRERNLNNEFEKYINNYQIIYTKMCQLRKENYLIMRLNREKIRLT